RLGAPLCQGVLEVLCHRAQLALVLGQLGGGLAGVLTRPHTLRRRDLDLGIDMRIQRLDQRFGPPGALTQSFCALAKLLRGRLTRLVVGAHDAEHNGRETCPLALGTARVEPAPERCRRRQVSPSSPAFIFSQISLHRGQTWYFSGSRLGTQTLPHNAMTGVPLIMASVSLSLGT